MNRKQRRHPSTLGEPVQYPSRASTIANVKDTRKKYVLPFKKILGVVSKRWEG